mmetsp:Transcript_24716/g.37562  ORF Transcript_24716/g.37562 Transcript_24716/m.37562 type:complete len:91 (+) Transcript_24716:45-317(+)
MLSHLKHTNCRTWVSLLTVVTEFTKANHKCLSRVKAVMPPRNSVKKFLCLEPYFPKKKRLELSFSSIPNVAVACPVTNNGVPDLEIMTVI